MKEREQEKLDIGDSHPADRDIRPQPDAPGRLARRGRSASRRPGHGAAAVGRGRREGPIDNALIAGRLEEFAALLELAGASPYSARAYRQAAELVRAAPVPVATLVRQGRVRELRGIGRGIEARLRELVETRRDRRARRAARARRRSSSSRSAACSGSAPSARLEIGAALGGSRPPSELRRGGARRPPARGARHRAEDARRRSSRRSREERTARAARSAAPARPRADRRRSPPRSAGTPPATRGAGSTSRRASRWSSRPTTPTAVRERFAALPEIVALLDAGDRHHGGRHPDRARGRAGRRARHRARARDRAGRARRGARPAADARPTRRAVYRRLGPRRAAARDPRRRRSSAAPPALVELGDDPRRPARAHDVVGRPGDACSRWALAARERGYEYLAICDHTPSVSVVAGPRRRRAAPSGRGDRRGQRAARAVPDPARRRVRHPRRRRPRRARRRAGRARLGAALAPPRAARAARAS